MSRKYIDYVVATWNEDDGSQHTGLFKAPGWSHLEKDDEIIIETALGKQRATVVASFTDAEDPTDSTVAFIVASMKATWPLKKVLGYYKFYEYDYCEEKENTDGQKEQTETL